MKSINYQHPLIREYKLIKKGTDHNRFVVEGLWAYEKLTGSNIKIEYLFVSSDYNQKDKKRIQHLMKISHVVYEISQKNMTRLTSKEKPSNIIMICSKENLTDTFKKVLVLDGLESPGNIGTIFRSCDGAGFDGIFIVNQKAKINQYKVIKASMGGYFNIPWKAFDTIESCAEYLIENDFKILLANPSDSHEKSHLKKVALVVGNERFGLSKTWFNYQHQTVSIPMKGFCDSLNVGVAASILMYEIIKGVQ